AKQEAFSSFKLARKRWLLLHELAAPTPEKPSDARKFEPIDFATNLAQFEALKEMVERAKGKTSDQIKAENPENDSALAVCRPATLPTARLRSWPFSEDRGPNPYLLAEGVLRKDAEGHRSVPWARGAFLSWLISDQLPVLAEPLIKFLSPI